MASIALIGGIVAGVGAIGGGVMSMMSGDKAAAAQKQGL